MGQEPIPLLDLEFQYDDISGSLEPALIDFCRGQRYILGQPVQELEQRIAEFCGMKFAIGVSSGSDAILASLMACGLKPGDLVATTPFTFFATAGAIARVGAIPVFVDIDPQTFNIDIEKLAEVCRKKDVAAIIPVDLFGQMARLDAIMEISQDLGPRTIEDAAQAIGAQLNDRSIGFYTDLCCLSFFPSKNLGCFGDGGMILTDDSDLADLCQRLRNHGAKPKYYHQVIGGNFRLDAMQAVVLLNKTYFLKKWTSMRIENAGFYDFLFKDTPIGVPFRDKDCLHVFNQYTIRIPDGKRDKVRDLLKANNIGCEVYYPKPLHLQPCFSGLGYKEGDLPAAEAASREVLSLPVYPGLKVEQQERVAQVVLAALE